MSDGSKDTGVEINTHGTRHLGAAVGTESFKREYVGKKVAHWVAAVKSLAEIAATEPHAAYAAFTHALQCQWTFLSRVMPDTHTLFQPLEDVIRRSFIKAITRKDVNNLERKMLSLPARLGGLGISNPVEACELAHANSVYISAPLVRLIERQQSELDSRELYKEIKALRKEIDLSNDIWNTDRLEEIKKEAPPALIKAVEAASDKGASSWVTAVPSYDHGTVLHKGDFVDALYIRYGWNILNLASHCGCGEAFSLEHALSCCLGGFRLIQHNEARDLIAKCMREAGFSAVETEPQLQDLTGETFFFKSAVKENEARSDIKCYGFWKYMRQAYFDIKVVSPFARSNEFKTPAALFRSNELMKIRHYKERINGVEQADFTPLVFTCAGGIAPQSLAVLKRLTERISERQNIHYSVVSGWLRTRLSFSLLRSTLLCVRGTRRKKVYCDNNIELAVNTARINY